MAYPTGTPVKEQVLDNLKTTLELIAGGASYHTTLRGVHRLRGVNAMQLQQFPAVIIDVAGTAHDDGVNGMVSCSMDVNLVAVITDRTDPAQELEWLAADIKRALLIDVTRGGAAVDTKFVSDDIQISDDVTSVAAVQVQARVRFRHLYADPNTSI